MQRSAAYWRPTLLEPSPARHHSTSSTCWLLSLTATRPLCPSRQIWAGMGTVSALRPADLGVRVTAVHSVIAVRFRARAAHALFGIVWFQLSHGPHCQQSSASYSIYMMAQAEQPLPLEVTLVTGGPQLQPESMASTAEERLGLIQHCFFKCLRFGLREPSMADLHAFFPGLPAPVVSALLDLHLQVLAHIEAHSQVRTCVISVALHHAVLR